MKITRFINGQKYTFELTPDELRAAFLEQDRAYLISDASYHFTEFLCRSIDAIADMSSDEIDEAVYAESGIGKDVDEAARTVYGFPLSRILADGVDAFLKDCTERYEKYQNVEIDELNTWEQAIRDVFQERYLATFIPWLLNEQMDRKFVWTWDISPGEMAIREFSSLRAFIEKGPALMQEMGMHLSRHWGDTYMFFLDENESAEQDRQILTIDALNTVYPYKLLELLIKAVEDTEAA